MSNKIRILLIGTITFIVLVMLHIILPLLYEADSNPPIKDLYVEAVKIFSMIAAFTFVTTALVTFLACVLHFASNKFYASFVPVTMVSLIFKYYLIFEYMLPLISESGVSDFVRNSWNESLKSRNMVMDRLQAEFRCCGIEAPWDYLIYMEKIHASCYVDGVITNDKSKLFKTGCKEILTMKMQPTHSLASMFFWITWWVEFLAFAFAVGVATIRVVDYFYAKKSEQTLNTTFLKSRYI